MMKFIKSKFISSIQDRRNGPIISLLLATQFIDKCLICNDRYIIKLEYFLLFFKCVSAVLNYWARQMREDNPLKMSFDLIPRFVCTHNFGSLECGPHFFRWLIDKQRTRLAATVVALVALQLDRMLKHHFLSPCHYFSRIPCQESNKKKQKKKQIEKPVILLLLL